MTNMNDLSLDKIHILLIDPDRASRGTIRNILVDNGFRNISQGAGLADIRQRFQISMPDLLICDHKPEDGNFNSFVYKLRHHEIGHNPFLPIIATAWTPNTDDVRTIIQAGTDDIITKPLSAGQLLMRIKAQIMMRKLYMVTSVYIGPDRRKPGDAPLPGEEGVPSLKVPNILRAKAMGNKNLDINALQQKIDACIKKVNLQKLDRHAHQALFLVERIIPGLAFSGPDSSTKRSLQRLLYVAEDTERRMVGTPFEHVGELCRSLVEVTGRIIKANDLPAPKDVDLLKPLAKAIQRGFNDSDTEAAKMAHKISQSVLIKK